MSKVVYPHLLYVIEIGPICWHCWNLFI